MHRALAAVTCLWFVVGGVLGMRHEATVAHVVDPLTGEIHHASAQPIGRHTCPQSDYHAASSHDAADDVCPISASLHQAVDARVARTVFAAAGWLTEPAPAREPIAVVAGAVYRLAPKTSPPSLG